MSTEYFGKFDFQTATFEGFRHEDVMGGKATVDGEEISDVWYADTEAGIVKTYNVLGDNTTHSGVNFTAEQFPGREIEGCGSWKALSETLRGKVRIFGA